MTSSVDSPNAYSELYAAYASGTLAPSFCLLVETHMQLRDDIRVSVAASEVIAGTQLEAAEPVALETLSVDTALALIDQMAPETAPAAKIVAQAVNAAFGEVLDLPQPLRDHAIDALGEKGWKGAGSGVKRLTLDVEDAAEVELYRIAPGATVPRHSHGGQEFTLVVSGGFTDENGSYGPGDMTIMGPDDTHKPVGDAGEPCFALAIRDAGLRFTGAMGLLQRALGQ